MTTAIGTALPVPPIPTSGAASPPIRNCVTPSSAEAVPATAAVLGERERGGSWASRTRGWT